MVEEPPVGVEARPEPVMVAVVVLSLPILIPIFSGIWLLESLLGGPSAG